MITLGTLRFALTLARLYIEPPYPPWRLANLGDREGPSLSRFLHTVSSAVLFSRWRLSDGLVTSSLPARSRHNIDRFLLTCVWHQHAQGEPGPMQPSIVYQVPLVRAYQDRNTCLKIGRTSLPPARQYHSDRLIPSLRWMLSHPLLPVEDKIRGAYPALVLSRLLHTRKVEILT